MPDFFVATMPTMRSSSCVTSDAPSEKGSAVKTSSASRQYFASYALIETVAAVASAARS